MFKKFKNQAIEKDGTTWSPKNIVIFNDMLDYYTDLLDKEFDIRTPDKVKIARHKELLDDIMGLLLINDKNGAIDLIKKFKKEI